MLSLPVIGTVHYSNLTWYWRESGDSNCFEAKVLFLKQGLKKLILVQCSHQRRL